MHYTDKLKAKFAKITKQHVSETFPREILLQRH